MATVVEAGLEPVSPPPEGLLEQLLQEDIVQSCCSRGYAVFRLDKSVQSHVSVLRSEMRRFFELPEDVKAKFAANKQVVESACYSHVASLKEYFQVRASGSGIDGIAFPSKEFAEAVLQVYGDFDEIGRKVFPLLLARTDVPQSDISKMIDPRPESSMGKIIVEYSDSSTTSNLVPTNYISSSNVDLFHYYNDPSTEAKWPMNHSSHTDSGILSFIPCSDEPGLDFYDQKLNCWLAIEDLIHRSAPGKYQEYGIVMVSDSIEQISKKQIAAGLHRVSRGVRPRDSIVFKMRGRPAYFGPKYEVDYKIFGIQEKATAAV